MYKQIMFTSNDKQFSIEKISSDFTLTKTASELSPKISNFISNINSDPKFVYILLIALGAGEIWGPNINSDYFPEIEIVNNYKTFEEVGHVFKHHKNKDPKNSIGRIVLSHWNPKMHRVELIVRVEREKAPRIASDIDNNKMWDVSMGCKVPFDLCSICGNKAYTKNDYCEHVRNHKGEILPGGKQVYMINVNPTYFDISFVYIGADKTSKTLMKVASAIKNKRMNKISEIEKEIPVQAISTKDSLIADVVMKEFNKIKDREEVIPDNIIDELSNDFSAKDLLTTLLNLGIILKPEEFQRMFLIKKGINPDHYKSVIISYKKLPKIKRWSPFDGNLNYGIIKLVKPFMESRSSLRPFLFPRLIKMAQTKEEKKKKKINKDLVTVPALMTAGMFYKRYLDKIPDNKVSGLDKKMKENPWMIPVTAAGSIGAIKGFQGMKKTAGNLAGRLFVGVPSAHLISHVADEDSPKVIRFIKNHPNAAALLGVAATNTADDWKALRETFNDFNKFDITKTSSAAIEAEDVFDNPASLFLVGKALKHINGE